MQGVKSGRVNPRELQELLLRGTITGAPTNLTGFSTDDVESTSADSFLRTDPLKGLPSKTPSHNFFGNPSVGAPDSDTPVEISRPNKGPVSYLFGAQKTQASSEGSTSNTKKNTKKTKPNTLTSEERGKLKLERKAKEAKEAEEAKLKLERDAAAFESKYRPDIKKAHDAATLIKAKYTKHAARRVELASEGLRNFLEKKGCVKITTDDLITLPKGRSVVCVAAKNGREQEEWSIHGYIFVLNGEKSKDSVKGTVFHLSGMGNDIKDPSINYYNIKHPGTKSQNLQVDKPYRMHFQKDDHGEIKIMENSNKLDESGKTRNLVNLILNESPDKGRELPFTSYPRLTDTHTDIFLLPETIDQDIIAKSFKEVSAKRSTEVLFTTTKGKTSRVQFRGDSDDASTLDTREKSVVNITEKEVYPHIPILAANIKESKSTYYSEKSQVLKKSPLLSSLKFRRINAFNSLAVEQRSYSRSYNCNHFVYDMVENIFAEAEESDSKE